MLMYANMAIDAFQSNKTNWINTFIKDESIKEPLQQFVDSQTAYTKQLVKTGWNLTGALAQATLNKIFVKGN